MYRKMSLWLMPPSSSNESISGKGKNCRFQVLVSVYSCGHSPGMESVIMVTVTFVSQLSVAVMSVPMPGMPGKMTMKTVTTVHDENKYTFEAWNGPSGGEMFKSIEITYTRM